MAGPRGEGLLAEFPDAERLMRAARQAHDAGYCRLDAFTPFPVEGLAEALGFTESRLPRWMLIGGLAGAAAAFFMQWYANVVSYPLNVGGRPLAAWPAFVLPAFETAVLTAVLAGIIGFLVLNRLPRLNHPLFDVPGFAAASSDRFFLLIGSDDPRFEPEATSRFLRSLGPRAIHRVPA